MKVSTECYDCLRRLAQQAVELATEDDKIGEQAMKAALHVLDRDFSPDVVSVEVATRIHDKVKVISQNPDPYRKVKDKEIAVAKRLSAKLTRVYNNGFWDVLKFSVLGNSMDFFRPLEEIDTEKLFQKIEFAIDESDILLERLKGCSRVLYLADNTGEAYFDIPLYKLMQRYAEVTYVVKAGPVQNDVTLEELKIAGLDKDFAKIIDTGTATPGIIMELASEEFRSSFKNADLIFAKGMGYYESLSELRGERRIFYCFKAKCGPVAKSIGVPVDSYVAKFL